MKKVSWLWKYAFLFLLGFNIGQVYHYYFENWDERVITREVIQGIDTLIKYKEEGKFEEADVLGDSLVTGIWYLRNSKITRLKFYDDLNAWFIGKYSSEEELRNIQNKLCPKSDLSRAYLRKEIPDKYEWKEEEIQRIARC